MLIRSLLAVTVVSSIFLAATPYLLLSSGLELGSYELGIARLFGIIPISVGPAVLFWCAWNFGSIGEGTPAPFDPPRKLVTGGLYRLVRNPMYIGAELILMGETILFQSLILLVYAFFLWILFHLFVVYYEEPNLRRKFGETYKEYCRVVPRWVPRLRKPSQ